VSELQQEVSELRQEVSELRREVSELEQELAGLVRQVTRESEVGPRTRLDGDLLMDSLEFAVLAGMVAERYGEHLDLEGFLAGLELDQIIELTVADIAGYIKGHA
jgi:acyl carrier protein